jgi:hypothetical protein
MKERLSPQREQKPGRIGRATLSLLRKLEWVGEEDSVLDHERGIEFLKTFMLLLAINGSAVSINAVNQMANGNRELLDSQKWMDGWDVFFPAFFVASRTADAKGDHYKASALRIIAYTGHAAVAYLGGTQTYGAMIAGVGETDSSLLLSGATGVANAALFVRELKHEDDHAADEHDIRNRVGLGVSVASNLAESAGGIGGAIAEFVAPPGVHASAIAGMGMSAVVGTGMLAATGVEIAHLRRLHKAKKTKRNLPVQIPLDRDGVPILKRDLMPDYSEYLDY